jgi:hypothetical protein
MVNGNNRLKYGKMKMEKVFIIIADGSKKESIY